MRPGRYVHNVVLQRAHNYPGTVYGLRREVRFLKGVISVEQCLHNTCQKLLLFSGDN